MKINFKEFLKISNLLSTLRLFLSIPIFFLLRGIDDSFSMRIIIASVLVMTALTDILDGYYARKYNQITELGKIIDPLADKIVIGVIIIQLYMMGKITNFYFIAIILRDVLIFLGGIYISRKIGKVLPSNILGKITVIVIGSYILAVVLQLNLYLPLPFKLLYLTSIALIFFSFIGYIIRAKESLNWYGKYESVQKL